MLLFEFSFHPNTHLQSFFSAFFGKNFRGCFTLFQTNNQYFFMLFFGSPVNYMLFASKK